MANDKGSVVHTTTHYHVLIGDGTYDIININTGIVEAQEKVLPQAILHAENSNSFMVNRLWRWVAAQGAQNGEALDKDALTSAFEIEQSLQ